MKPIGPTPSEIKKGLLDKWSKGEFFRKFREAFPLQVPLGKISSAAMTERFDDLRQWISLYGGDSRLAPYLRWETVNHRLLGKNRIPRRLVFEKMENLAEYLNRRNEWDCFARSLEELKRADERLVEWGVRYPLDMLGAEGNLNRLLLLWKWMVDNPRPDIYLRQIDLPGIDTKFVENHKKTLSRWLDLTLPEEQIDSHFQGLSHFEGRYGYRGKPELIRFMFLDPSLQWRGCSDLSVPADQFCRIFSPDDDIPVEHVFVVENDICGLTFPPVKKGMVVFGRGYHFENWSDAHWLKKVRLVYWGDLDTHGFAILSQFRALFPHTRSMLMDRKTLLTHKVSWGVESKPATVRPEFLTDEEGELFDDLRLNRIQPNLRLEQEFIRYSLVEQSLKNL